MITRNFEITIRIPEQNYIPTLFQVVENDNGVYNLTIHITDGINEIDYSQVSSATITFALANGAVVQSDPERLTVSATGIIYQMGTSEIACPGKVLASIQLFGEDGGRLTTARFQFEVVADLISPKAVQSESRFPLLQQLVADVEQLKQDIVNLQIPDGSIMDVKLSDAAGQIKQRFAAKNLLHNWDFRNPVNQRGQSSYSGAGYTVDGWTLNSQVLNLKEGYVELRRTLVTGAPTLSQYIENYGSYADETLTFSTEVKVTAGKTVTVLMTDGVNAYSQSYSPGASKWNIITVSGKINAAPSHLRCAIQIASASAAVGDAVWVRRAKLELGSISTLANDAPPKIATVLAECQRYFRLWRTEAARTAALNEVGLMRLAAPTLGTIVIGGTTYYTASADL